MSSEQPLITVFGVKALCALLKHKIGKWHCLIDLTEKSVLTLFTNNGVGVFTLRQKQEACLAAIEHGWQASFKCARSCFSPCLIAVEAENHLTDVTKQFFEMGLPDAGSEGRDCIQDIVLRQCHHIHIAFNHNGKLRFAFSLQHLVEAI